MSKVLVLVVRNSLTHKNCVNGIDSMEVTFGEVDTETNKYHYLSDFVNEDHSEFRGLSIRCQWNTVQDAGSAVPTFAPYATRVQSEDFNIENFEHKVKAFKKIKKHLEDVPECRENFGMYVYNVCNVIKAKHFVVNPESYEVTEMKPIKDVVELLNTRIQAGKTKEVPATV